MDSMFKKCSKCGEKKPLFDFSKNKVSKSGLHPYCKSCKNILSKNHYQANKVKVLEKMKLYYVENKDQISQRVFAWRTKNPDAKYLIDSRWRKTHGAASRAKHRLTQKKATPLWANLNSIDSFYRTANDLGMYTGDFYEVDHVIPLTSKLVCGLHCEANLRVIPRSENRSKSNRYWPDMP